MNNNRVICKCATQSLPHKSEYYCPFIRCMQTTFHFGFPGVNIDVFRSILVEAQPENGQKDHNLALAFDICSYSDTT